MATSSIGFNSRTLPTTFSDNAYSSGKTIEEGGCLNGLFRACIPGVAAYQDDGITAFYLEFFKRIGPYQGRDAGLFASLVQLSSEHIEHCAKSWFSLTSMKERLVRLERYTLAARLQIGGFTSEREQEAHKELCARHCYPLFASWQKMHLPSEVFFYAPDLVDLVMKTFLKSIFRLPFYQNGIDWIWTYSEDEGGRYLVEPRILVEGEMIPWNEVRQRFIADGQGHIYSLDTAGKKVHWWYLDKGMLPWNKRHWDRPLPFTTLRNPPPRCQVQIITSHAKEDARFPIIDRYLDGVRHASLRIVFGKDFEKRNPDSNCRDGEVYSFGYVPNLKDFSPLRVLATIRGDYMSPDYSEYGEDDLCVTPLDLSDEKTIELFERLVDLAHEATPYHFIDANCASSCTDVLSELEIIRLPTDTHMISMWYDVFFPEPLQNILNRAGRFISERIPSCIIECCEKVRDIFHSTIVAPILLIIGGWKVHVDSEAADYLQIKDVFQPHFEKLQDVFNPNKLIFKVPKMIHIAFQKNNPNTYIERH